MAQTLTPSQENYLEHILQLSRKGPVRVREIAEAAGVKLPSVTRAVGKLAAHGFVRHQAYGSVEITPEGVKAAQAVVRRDDCLMGLLVDVLDMDEEIAKLEKEIEKQIGEACFAVYGTSIPPDATMSLRISDGEVKGYDYNGTVAPHFTTLYGLFARNAEFGDDHPFDIPQAWKGGEGPLDAVGDTHEVVEIPAEQDHLDRGTEGEERGRGEQGTSAMSARGPGGSREGPGWD